MEHERVSWRDSNLALVGSELDRKVKAAAAQGEPAWKGMGLKPELRVWRVEKFQVKPWPQDQYGKFHKGDSYIVLNTYKKGNAEALYHDVHMWIGEESSQDEYGTAAYKLVEADDYLGGKPVQHRQVQGHEDESFLSNFHAVEYLDGGIESGFNHVEPDPTHPVLFRVKGTKKRMTLTQVPLSRSSLNSGDSFILYGGKAKVWCWHGKHAKPLEKAHSNQWAEKMCTLGTVATMDQGQDDEMESDFWDLLGSGTIGEDMNDDEGVTQCSPQLFRVDGDASKDMELIATGVPTQRSSRYSGCFKRCDLKDGDVFLVDTGWEIFVWIGKDANRDEKLAAMTAADRYTKLDPRTLELPVHIIKSGNESQRFQEIFA